MGYKILTFIFFRLITIFLGGYNSKKCIFFKKNKNID